MKKYLDTIELIVASELFNLCFSIGLAQHHVTLLVAGKFVEQVLVREFLGQWKSGVPKSRKTLQKLLFLCTSGGGHLLCQ